MRSFLALALFLAGGGGYLYLRAANKPSPTASTSAPTPVDRARDAVKLQECMDGCDQASLVEGEKGDELRRSCRARCTAGGSTVADDRPRERIQSFTRAPASHAKTPSTGRITVTGQK